MGDNRWIRYAQHSAYLLVWRCGAPLVFSLARHNLPHREAIFVLKVPACLAGMQTSPGTHSLLTFQRRCLLKCQNLILWWHVVVVPKIIFAGCGGVCFNYLSPLHAQLFRISVCCVHHWKRSNSTVTHGAVFKKWGNLWATMRLSLPGGGPWWG